MKKTDATTAKKVNPRRRFNRKKAPAKAPAASTAPPKRRPRTKKNAKPKVQQVTQSLANSNLKMAIAVTADFDPEASHLMYASLYAYLCNKGLFSTTDNDRNVAQSNISGFNFMFDQLIAAIKNGVIGLNRAPEVILDMINALMAKDITFMTYSKLNFSFAGVLDMPQQVVIPANGGIWRATYCEPTNVSSYDSPAIVANGNSDLESYSILLQKMIGLTTSTKLSVVDAQGFKSVLKNDASSFARSYVYNGLQPSSAGGYYKDVENEVGITAPMLSSFARYGDPGNESRVPTKLTAYAGDAALSIGWPLHNTFVSYFNKRSPAFKVLDFEWFYGFMVQWLCLAMPKATALNTFPPGQTIGMTQQDFRIILRQALLNCFDTQYMLQFTGPLQFASNDNGFCPFQVSGGSYGSAVFNTLLVPTLLQENINALKARSIRVTAKNRSKINVMTFFPVLGRYIQDTPVTPQYTLSDGVNYPLFDPPGNQQVINLIDGTINSNNYVNLNSSYYQTKMANYNFFISELTEVVSKTTSIVGDNGPPGLGCLYYTSVQNKVEETLLQALPRSSYAKYTNTIVNLNRAPVVRSKSSKDSAPMAVPPATLATLTQNATTATLPINSELQSFLDTIIVPTIRLDPNGNSDQLSLQMYQIETKEGVTTKYNDNANVSGGGAYSRLGKYAQLCITGVGHDSSSEYDKIMQALIEHNDAGMLSGILGGLAKTILPPSMHGIVDTISDVVPF